MLDPRQKYDLDRVFRILLTLAGGVALYTLLNYLSDVLAPFVVAFAFAYLLNPIATYLQRKTKHRFIAVALTLFGFAAILTAVVAVVVPRVVAELSGLSRFIADHAKKGPEYWDQAKAQLSPEVIDLLRDFVQSDAMQDLATFAVPRIAPGVWGLVTGTFSIVVALMTGVIMLMYLALLLMDFRRVENSWKDYLPPRHRETIVEFLLDFDAALSRYFRGQVIVACLVGILFSIGFSIVGIRLAIVLGLFIGLLNMVPYLQTVAIVPAFLLALLRYLEQGSGFWWYMIGVALVFAIVQIIQDGFLVPKIVGDVTGLRPALVMLSIFVWGKLLGFVGLVLAIPLTVLAVTYYERLLASQRKAEQLASSPPAADGGVR